MRASVPAVVREIVTRNRSIHDCMRMNVINYTALAMKIRPEIERLLGSPVNLNTIVVAIKRQADSFGQAEDVREGTVLKNARLSLIDGIVDVRIPAGDFEPEAAALLFDRFSRSPQDYDLFRMAGTIRVLAEDAGDIRSMFGPLLGDFEPSSSGLVKIKITAPEYRNRSDVVSYVVETLHYNGIELVNVSFDRGNVVLILNEDDAPKAYEVLRSKTSV